MPPLIPGLPDSACPGASLRWCVTPPRVGWTYLQPAIAELVDAVKFNRVLTGAEAVLSGDAVGEPSAEASAAGEA